MKKAKPVHSLHSNSLLSNFAHDPELVEETADELDAFEQFWKPHIRELKRHYPNAILVYIWGNHETRIKRFLETQAPKLRKRVLREFVRIIRYTAKLLNQGGGYRTDGDTLIIAPYGEPALSR